MEDIAHCIVCGRVLTAPESIARGMGPKCAGESSTGRKRKPRRRSTHMYAGQSTAPHSAALSLFAFIDDKWTCNCETNNVHPIAQTKCETCGVERVTVSIQELEDAIAPQEEYAVMGQSVVCAKDLPKLYGQPGQCVARKGDLLTVIDIDENGVMVESATASFYVVEDEITEVE